MWGWLMGNGGSGGGMGGRDESSCSSDSDDGGQQQLRRRASASRQSDSDDDLLLPPPTSSATTGQSDVHEVHQHQASLEQDPGGGGTDTPGGWMAARVARLDDELCRLRSRGATETELAPLAERLSTLLHEAVGAGTGAGLAHVPLSDWETARLYEAAELYQTSDGDATAGGVSGDAGGVEDGAATEDGSLGRSAPHPWSSASENSESEHPSCWSDPGSAVLSVRSADGVDGAVLRFIEDEQHASRAEGVAAGEDALRFGPGREDAQRKDLRFDAGSEDEPSHIVTGHGRQHQQGPLHRSGSTGHEWQDGEGSVGGTECSGGGNSDAATDDTAGTPPPSLWDSLGRWGDGSHDEEQASQACDASDADPSTCARPTAGGRRRRRQGAGGKLWAEQVAERAVARFYSRVGSVSEARATFKQHDTDRSGGLDAAELVMVFASKRVRLSTVEAAAVVRAFGGGRATGQVSEEAFVEALRIALLEAVRVRLLDHTAHSGQDWSTLFARLDRDGSGGLSPAEFSAAVRKVGVFRAPAAAEERWRRRDQGRAKHGSGRAVVDRERADRELAVLFGWLDRDGDGKISTAELTAFLQAGPRPAGAGGLSLLVQRMHEHLAETKSNLRATFAAADRDGSGRLDREELSSWLRKLGLPHSADATHAVMVELAGDGSTEAGDGGEDSRGAELEDGTVAAELSFEQFLKHFKTELRRYHVGQAAHLNTRRLVRAAEDERLRKVRREADEVADGPRTEALSGTTWRRGDLWRASSCGNLRRVTALLLAGVDPNDVREAQPSWPGPAGAGNHRAAAAAAGDGLESPLGGAARGGHSAVCRALLASGGHVEPAHCHVACQHGHAEVLLILASAVRSCGAAARPSVPDMPMPSSPSSPAGFQQLGTGAAVTTERAACREAVAAARAKAEARVAEIQAVAESRTLAAVERAQAEAARFYTVQAELTERAMQAELEHAVKTAEDRVAETIEGISAKAMVELIGEAAALEKQWLTRTGQLESGKGELVLQLEQLQQLAVQQAEAVAAAEGLAESLEAGRVAAGRALSAVELELARQTRAAAEQATRYDTDRQRLAAELEQVTAAAGQRVAELEQVTAAADQRVAELEQAAAAKMAELAAKNEALDAYLTVDAQGRHLASVEAALLREQQTNSLLVAENEALNRTAKVGNTAREAAERGSLSTEEDRGPGCWSGLTPPATASSTGTTETAEGEYSLDDIIRLAAAGSAAVDANRGSRKKPDWAKMAKHSAGAGVHLDSAARRQRQQAAAVQAIRQMISAHRHLFGEEITDATSLFRAIDTDRGGTIERAEFDRALARLGLGLSQAQLSELWGGLDRDGNGVLDYAELLAELDPSPPPAAGEAVEAAPAMATHLWQEHRWQEAPQGRGSAAALGLASLLPADMNAANDILSVPKELQAVIGGGQAGGGAGLECRVWRRAEIMPAVRQASIPT